MRQILIAETGEYTKCGEVSVNCADDACSNLGGGPWLATACGVQYRCSHTAARVACMPLHD